MGISADEKTESLAVQPDQAVDLVRQGTDHDGGAQSETLLPDEGAELVGNGGPTVGSAGLPDRWRRRGTTWNDVSMRLFARRQLCAARERQHYHRAHRWSQVAAPLSWLTAVLAAVSGLSIVADYTVAATILGIATAIAAATNAALSPSDAARFHRAAATAYGKLLRKIDDYAWFTVEDQFTLIPTRQCKAVMAAVREMEGELSAIEESHPPISGIPEGAGVPESRQPEHVEVGAAARGS